MSVLVQTPSRHVPRDAVAEMADALASSSPVFSSPPGLSRRSEGDELPRLLGFRWQSVNPSSYFSEDVPMPVKVSWDSLSSLKDCKSQLSEKALPNAPLKLHLAADIALQVPFGSSIDMKGTRPELLQEQQQQQQQQQQQRGLPSVSQQQQMRQHQQFPLQQSACASLRLAPTSSHIGSAHEELVAGSVGPAIPASALLSQFSGMRAAGLPMPAPRVEVGCRQPVDAIKLDQVLPSSADSVSMACDPARHGVLLQLLGNGPTEEQRHLLEALSGSFLQLSQDKNGCRVVQQVVEVAPRELQIATALELKGHIVELTTHMHGNFVVQKVVEQLPPVAMDFIIDEVEGQACMLASHIYGCRVMQRVLEHCGASQLRGIVGKLLHNVQALSRDNFGNNVIRHLLEHGCQEDQKKIIQAMSSNIMELGTHKSSSLVLEKCLVVAAQGKHAKGLEDERAGLVWAILATAEDKATTQWQQPLEVIMLNQFGNYLVQRVVECSRGEEREVLRNRLRAAEPALRASASGKHILAAMRRQFGGAKQQSAGRAHRQRS